MKVNMEGYKWHIYTHMYPILGIDFFYSNSHESFSAFCIMYNIYYIVDLIYSG